MQECRQITWIFPEYQIFHPLRPPNIDCTPLTPEFGNLSRAATATPGLKPSSPFRQAYRFATTTHLQLQRVQLSLAQMTRGNRSRSRVQRAIFLDAIHLEQSIMLFEEN